MKTTKMRTNHAARLDTGDAILAAARVEDITLVKARLGAFAGAQRRFAEAQRQVAAADARLREGQVRLARCDAEQDQAVEGLALALISGGQPRAHPFAAFGTEVPSDIKHLRTDQKAKAIGQLVAAVQRQKPVGKMTLHAAEAAEHAAQRAEAALLAADKLQQTLDKIRRARDEIAQTWDTSLAALKRGARAAADDGAPGLYAALFGRMARPRIKKKPQPTPAPPAVTTAA